jgi:hypothetical protein
MKSYAERKIARQKYILFQITRFGKFYSELWGLENY